MANALYVLRQDIGRNLGFGLDAPLVLCQPTGGHAVGTCQASALDAFEDDYFNEWWLRGYLGTHKDLTRTVTDFAKTNGVLTWSPAFSAVTDTTDYFELWRDDKISPDQVNALINEAIRAVEDEYLANKIDESLVINDILTNGLMETWSDASTPGTWTTGGAGTIARESTIRREGTYSAKLINTVGNAYWLTQSLSNYSLYAAKSMTLHAWVYATVADRARIRLTDGVTIWNSSYHQGKGWEELSIDGKTLSTALTELTASFRIETGAQITAYCDRVWLSGGDSIYEYTIPAGFYTVESVYQEQSTLGKFSQSSDRIDPLKGWRILVNGTNKKIWFDPSIASLTAGRKLRIEGQAKASSLTLDADTTNIPPAYIRNYCLATILREPKYFDMAQKARSGLQIAPRGWAVDS